MDPRDGLALQHVVAGQPPTYGELQEVEKLRERLARLALKLPFTHRIGIQFYLGSRVAVLELGTGEAVHLRCPLPEIPFW